MSRDDLRYTIPLKDRPRIPDPKTGEPIYDFKPDRLCAYGECINPATTWLSWPAPVPPCGYCALHAIDTQAAFHNTLTVIDKPRRKQ